MISSVAARGNTLAMSNRSKRFAPKLVVLAVVLLQHQLLQLPKTIQSNQSGHNTQHLLKLQSKLQYKRQFKHQFKVQFLTHLSIQSLKFSETDQATKRRRGASPQISTLDQSSKCSPSTSQSTKSQSTRLLSSRLLAATSSLVVLPGSRSVEMHRSRSSVLELAVSVATSPTTLLQSLKLSKSLSTGLLNVQLFKLRPFSNQFSPSTKLQLNQLLPSSL
jgi:hypothetical protein